MAGSRVVRFVGDRLRWKELKRSLRTIFRSTAIGTGIGLVPGLGQPIAAMMGYIAAKNASKHPERYGKGELDGVAGAEAANNAVNGPTMVPLLTLGIPGDAVTALLLGAFMMQGLRPGPTLLETSGDIVFAILIAMVFANLLFVIIGYFTIPLFARVVTIKRSLLIPITIMLAFAGTYLARGNPFDIVTLIGFGLVGIAAREAKFDVAPMVMGFILGRELEYQLRPDPGAGRLGLVAVRVHGTARHDRFGVGHARGRNAARYPDEAVPGTGPGRAGRHRRAERVPVVS